MDEPKTVGTCDGDCGRLLVPMHLWTLLTVDERRPWRATHVSHAGRGLCWRCRERVKCAGTLVDYERRSVPAAMVVEEWERMDHRADDSQNDRIRDLAPRLGMTPKALCSAVRRAKRAGLVA